MIKIMMGEKGTGKTKVLINMVNDALKSEMGKVVCIDKGNRFVYDLDHAVRLIDTAQFNIKNLDVFTGFIEGVIAHDFDVTHIFIDSVLKIAPGTMEELETFLAGLERIAKEFSIKFTLTISGSPSLASEGVKKYFIKF